MAQRYRVMKFFAHEGEIMTNDKEDEIKALPRKVRDHHIERGNLLEWDDKKEVPEAIRTSATVTQTKEK